MSGARALVPVILVVVAAQAEPRQDCVTCHRAQAVSQPETSMGHALESVAACGILRAHSRLALRVGAYSYQIERQDDRSIYTVTDGKGTITTPIAWAFGLGAAGQTYVYQWQGNWYESRVSFYKKLDGLDLTMGALKDNPHPGGGGGAAHESQGRR